MIYLVTIFSIIWLIGWLASAQEVELEHSDRFWRKVSSYAILFFIWPYIAFVSMRDK